jgi:hypothetical protein
MLVLKQVIHVVTTARWIKRNYHLNVFTMVGHCVLQMGSGRLGSVLRHLCWWLQISTCALCRGGQRDQVEGKLRPRRGT